MAESIMLAVLRFEQPIYLWLLLIAPLLVAWSYPKLAGLGDTRRIIALAARAGVITLLALALAGASRVQTAKDLTVLFLLDRSNSIPRNVQRDAFAQLKQKSTSGKPDDRVGIIAFDGAAAVEQLPMAALAIDRVTDPLRPDHTDIAASMRLALALFPPDSARRVVLLSDGNENVGEALREADSYKAANVPIDVLPLAYEHGNEVVFEQLRTPPTAAADETVAVQMIIRSQRPARGRVLLYDNDQLVDFGDGGGKAGSAIMLDAGPNRIVKRLPIRGTRPHRFKAVFEPDEGTVDTISANNEGQSFTVVSGPGKILILTTQDDENLPTPSARVLAAALQREKLDCEVEIAGSRPIDQVTLLEYTLVILANVPKNDLSDASVQALATYVRDVGGGLIMLGGDQSFGAGGWTDTPIEEVMPVSFDVKNKKQIPKGALVLVMHACEVPNGNYIGERCAVAAIKTLSTRDLVGVLSYRWISDQQGFWDIPLRVVGNKTEVLQQVLKMQMGDMPDLHEVMAPGVDALIARKDAAAKHMIIVSDFDPAAPSSGLIDKMKKNGITCSTVAIGYGGHQIDESKAKWIADSTGGKFYATDKFDELPQIFIKEARIVQRSLLQEQPFTPRLVNALPTTVRMLMGDGLPELRGYVLTTAKPSADIPLVRATEEGNDPVLAQWQVGLGKTVAFTSGMWSRWGNDWAAWPKFAPLWGQIARWASKQGDRAGLDVTTSVQGGVGRVRVEAADEAAVQQMQLGGTLILPNQEAVPLRLTQVGPGKYEGEFDASDRGNYILNLSYASGVGANAQSGTVRTGVSVAYSPEFEELQTNLPLIEEIRSRAGGRNLAADPNSSVFDRASLPRVEARRPIWEDLMRWMLILFLLDVAIRRVAINPLAILRGVRTRIAEGAGTRQTGEASAAVLTSLKGAKAKADTTAKPAAGKPGVPEQGAPPSRAAKYDAPANTRRGEGDLSQALGGASGEQKPVVAPPTRKKADAGEADYTSRLLKAKKRARQDDEGDGPTSGE
ncbi:MAG: VWA domain-containing protein [Phycisphaerae bacterium]|nr:VWA domain-containing protein [Phycisphaerae bacterium]